MEVTVAFREVVVPCFVVIVVDGFIELRDELFALALPLEVEFNFPYYIAVATLLLGID